MTDGHWTAVPYLDEHASPEQRTALDAIFGGAAGGWLAQLALLITENPPRFLRMVWRGEDGRRSPRVLELLHVTVEAAIEADGAEVVENDASGSPSCPSSGDE